MFKARADFREVKAAAETVRRAVPRVLRAAVGRAAELTRDEFPHERFRRGIKPVVDGAAGGKARGRVVAELLLKREAGQGTLHLPGGATRRVDLRGSKPFNVLEGVETGTGLHGPKGRVIRPNRARALLVRADSVRPGEAFITAPGGPYVLRRESEGMRPDDYPGRAVERLDGELDGLVDRELEVSGL